MIFNIYETEPDFINEEGVKFWYDESSTNYAKKIGLENVVIFFIEESNKRKTRLITENQEVLGDYQQLEALCVKLDMIALSRGISKNLYGEIK